jgi:Flp pilus assembly pilin Flp
MLNLIKKLVREDGGQDLAEYGIALAVIAIGAALIAVAIGSDVQTLGRTRSRLSTPPSRPRRNLRHERALPGTAAHVAVPGTPIGSPSSNRPRGGWMMRIERVIAFIRKDEGQDLAEYGIALAVVAIGIALIAVAIGSDVSTLWSNAQPVIRSVIDAEP